MNQARQILVFVIEEKSRGNTFMELNIQMKIMLKGINVKGILDNTVQDDPVLIEKLKHIAKEFEIDLNKMPPV